MNKILTQSDLVTQFFLSNMTYIWTWPRYHQDKNSDKVSWKLKQIYGLKRVNMVLKQFDLLTKGFSVIWPTDLVFDQGWSIFNLDQFPWRLDQNCGF